MDERNVVSNPFITLWIVIAVYFEIGNRPNLHTYKDEAMNRNASDNRLENDRRKVASSTASQATNDGRDYLLPCPDNAVRFRQPEPGQTAPKLPPLWRRVATRFSKLVITACRGPLM